MVFVECVVLQLAGERLDHIAHYICLAQWEKFISQAVAACIE